MKRYMPRCKVTGCGQADMVECESGPWIKFEDINNLLDFVFEEIEDLSSFVALASLGIEVADKLESESK